MTNETLLDTVQTLIKQVTSNQDAKITASTVIDEIDGWDSLCTVDLEMELESTLDINFEIGEFQEFKDIQTLMDSLQNKIK